MKLLAVSGGVDSMALLHMLKEENISVVHINHNTRGVENKQEEKLVEEFCKQNSIPFYKFDFKYDGQGNFHKTARAYRYNIFKKVAAKRNIKHVYLAHHLDDQVENILMNPKKIGSKIMEEEENINGLKIIRPLLNKSKHEIYKYAKINDVRYLEDSSNSSEKYYRNRVRKKLKAYTDDQKFEIYKKEQERTHELKKLIKKYEKKETINSTSLIDSKDDIYCFLKSKEIITNISLNKINLINSFLKEDKNGSITIDKNNVLVCSYKNVYVRNIVEELEIKISSQTFVKENQEIDFNGIVHTYRKNGQLRTANIGEKIRIKNGHKKVSRFFIDEKIPKEYRKIWPILVDENDQIIYIPKMKEVNIKKG